MKEKEKKLSVVNLILIIQIVIMIIITVVMTSIVTKVSAENAKNHMGTITDERAHIIRNYVQNAEKTLTAYSRAGQIYDVLQYPNDDNSIRNAQKFTENFSKDIENLEGIYVSTWETKVLAHTNSGTVGMITREGERLKQLQDSMIKAGDGVYDTGIIISPASKEQIVSMYKAVYDETGKPIGLVGLGIYTAGLVDTLDNLKIQGINDAFYSMVNVSDKKYIFHTDKAKVTTEADNSKILDLCKKYSSKSSSDTGNFEYKNKEKAEYVSSYTYMGDYGWILMLDAPSEEVYAMEHQLRIFIWIFSALIIGLIVVFAVINRKQELINEKLSKQVTKTEKTKESLNTAIFMDILTNVRNRTAFAMDLDKGRPDASHTCYFAMVNIADFSNINTHYGNDTGDAVLVATADKMASAFPEGVVYRTGSDEFILAVQKENTTASYQEFASRVQLLYNALLDPLQTPAGMLQIPCRITAVKKSADLNASLITIMKDIMNNTKNALSAQIDLTDLDTLA